MVGAAVGVPVAWFYGLPWLVGLSLFAALVPDLDAPDATLKHWTINLGDRRHGTKLKPFAVISSLMTLVFPHRGFVHSLYAALTFSLVGAALALLWQLAAWWPVTLALLVGYISHLLLDALTPSGIPLWLKGDWHLFPKLRIPTGSYLEHLMIAVAAVIVLGYLVIAGLAGSTGSIGPTGLLL